MTLLFIWVGFNSFAQVPNQIGARSNGMANSALLLKDVWGIKNNLGAFGSLEQTSIGVAYQNRFLLNEFANQSVAFNYSSLNAGNFGFYFQQTGFSLYRQSVGGLAYGMKLNPKMSAGVSLNWHRVAFGDIYGSKNAFSASLGLMYSLNDHLDMGVNVANLNRAKLDDYQDERFPTVFNLGLKYNFSEGTFWSLETEKDIYHPINIKSGIEIKAHEMLSVRMGMNSYPFKMAFGAGLNIKKLKIDIASEWHSTLGLNPSMSLNYRF